MIDMRDAQTYFDAEVTSVNIVSEEEIASPGGFTTDFEEFHEIKLRIQYLARFAGSRTMECAHIDHGCHRRLEKGIRLDDDALEHSIVTPVTGNLESMDKTFGSARNSCVAFSMI